MKNVSRDLRKHAAKKLTMKKENNTINKCNIIFAI